ncbi:MAG: type I-E CRISPR-associated protein Cas7/Cse4/CasC [Clostridia bacterium]|nr:type I-E CRISPR-associated protein Cas7/Cse4/CasC [Clostridia bacterium]
MLIEIHMLTNYPPTNLNRDDTGAPKTCLFGGENRARISSQCLKHSWRTSPVFIDAVGAENLGIRTRQLPELVAEKLREEGVDPEWADMMKAKISGIANKAGKESKDGSTTAQMIFYAPEDIAAVAGAVKGLLDDCSTLADVKKLKAKSVLDAIKDAKTRPITVDIALFGRMVTSDAFADVDGAMQVAHAVSTNKVMLESDFFTAMDDLLAGDTMEDLGAGMMGETGYDSSCYYVYASVDTDELKKNLKNTPDADVLTEKIVPILVETMAYSDPGGKQNSFAGHPLPSAVLIECKEKKIPTSRANAFAKPVRPGYDADLIERSIERLADETARMDTKFGIPVAKRLWFTSTEKEIPLPENCDGENCATFPDLIAALREVAK